MHAGFTALLRTVSKCVFHSIFSIICSYREGGCGIRGFVEQLRGEEGVYIRDGLHLSGKGAGVLADGLKRGWTEGIGKASSTWTRAVY